MSLDPQVKTQIEKDIKANKVVLYMKGTPEAPQCGFSAQVIKILNNINVPFHSKDILQDNALREGIKAYSDWPTIPQLYVNGQFVGGCDIITEMAQNGELKKVVDA